MGKAKSQTLTGIYEDSVAMAKLFEKRWKKDSALVNQKVFLKFQQV